QDRGCRQQSTFFEVIGKPSQVEAGEHDSGDVAIASVEPLREVYHLPAVGRVDPVISYGKSRLSHSSREKRLICYRRERSRLARAKNSTSDICCSQQAII